MCCLLLCYLFLNNYTKKNVYTCIRYRNRRGGVVLSIRIVMFTLSLLNGTLLLSCFVFFFFFNDMILQ